MFGFTYVGINDRLPEHIINTFSQFSYLGVSDAANLYLSILDNYPDEFGGAYFGIDVLPFWSDIIHFIDFDTNTVNFSDHHFIESFMLYSTVMQRINIPTRGIGIGVPITAKRFVSEHSENHMFYGSGLHLNPADAFFDRDIPFSHFIPLANDHGELILNNADNTPGFAIPTVWMSAAGDTELSWEFIQHLIVAFSQPQPDRNTMFVQGVSTLVPWGSFSFNIPIKRSLFESHMSVAFRNIHSYDNQFPRGELFDIAATEALERIYRYSNMPMVKQFPSIPMDLISEPLNDFTLGLISAETAITQAENALTLWFMEQ